MPNIKCCTLFVFSIAAAIAQADVKTDVDFSSRTRVAEVDTGAAGRDLSVLLRVNALTQWSEELGSKIELDNVTSFFPNEHSDGVRLNDKPTIPDAVGTNLNQAFLSYKTNDVQAAIGRQRLNIDNQRFVGGNGFWQNEQTFDAAHSRFTFQTNSQVTYTYVWNVNRITGDRADKFLKESDAGYEANKGIRPVNILGNHRHNTHLLHVEWNEWDYTQWIAYAYWMDNKTQPSVSNNTFGMSYHFNYKSDLFKYRVEVESATQTRQDKSNRPAVPYYRVDAGVGINNIEFSNRYEVLGARDGIVFITPLASLHDFQGWANRFGVIPAQGIRDESLRVLWRASPIRIEGHYHFFNDERHHAKLGQELDIDIVYKPQKKHALSLRMGSFNANDAIPDNKDIRKMYLDYTYNF